MAARLALASLLLAALGCPQAPAAVCARYVECQAAYDAAAGHVAKDTSLYEQGGACWREGQSAARCAVECDAALAALREAATASALDVPACR